jgi:hypothetical protein
MGEVSSYPDINTIHPNRLISYYMMSSYLYYQRDKHVLTDPDYDTMCKRILAEWSNIKHQHKRRVKRKSLEAGTGYQLKNYPNIVMSAAERWFEEWEKESG